MSCVGVSRRSNRPRAGLVCSVLALGLAACQGPPPCPDRDDIPGDFDCPVLVDRIALGQCERVPQPPPTALVPTLQGERLHLAVAHLPFRERSDVCGFADRDGDDVRVLLQPCELVRSDAGAMCLYDSIELDVVELDLTDATGVVLLHRVEQPSAVAPAAPQVVAVAALP
ncbi:MAG: hypothetical protein K1X88_29240 [Nannocystaceae bacterium]|nr:hypothetical protein [Nannocystaceae bacterium]